MTTKKDTESFDQLRSQGWEVLESGWPDGLALSPDKSTLVGVELKRPSDGITANQITCGQWLSRFGIHWVVAREAASMQTLVLPSNLPQQEARSPSWLAGRLVALEDEWLVSP